MSPKEQASALIGAINLLGEISDELGEKELYGAGDEVVRCQATLRRQLVELASEAALNKVELKILPLRSVVRV